MKIENIKPDQIETRSFEIITEILGDRELDPRYEAVIKRCIHTSADFEYADSLYFTDGVIERIQSAIKGGAYIVTDTKMGPGRHQQAEDPEVRRRSPLLHRR